MQYIAITFPEINETGVCHYEVTEENYYIYYGVVKELMLQFKD